MSFGGFILGVLLMIVGFLMVWKTFWFERNFGDIGVVIGMQGKSWMSWKVLGLALLILGFLVGFGLLQFFFAVTIGQLFRVGGL